VLVTSKLTLREQQIAKLISRGWSTRQISDALGIGEGTVKNATRQISHKLGVDNRVMIAVMCVTDPKLKKELEAVEV
jgi:DNA-binding NarL/FixJ family response regulator